MMKKAILSIIIILLMAIPALAREPKPEGTLVIAISKDFEPFTFLNAEGRPAGMFVDIWRLWAQKTGKKIEFISSDWKTSLENLKNHKADIHSGFLYSPEHFEWISVSQPIYEVGVNLFYPLKKGKIADIKEFSGQTVAAIRGSQLDQFLKKHYPDIPVYPCDTREELVRVSREGKAWGFIAISPVGSAVIDRMGLSGEFQMYDKTLYKEVFLAGVLKKNTELLALVDKGLKAISNQELADIEARWIPDPKQRYYKASRIIQLTPQEEAWLKKHKTIRIGMSPVFPPLKFSEKGVIKGIEPDYLNLLSEYTGIQFEYVICDFPVMDAKVKSGEIDMFISFYIPECFEYMTLTEPLMDFKQVIITRTDAPFMSGIGALKGKKVATVKGVKLYDKILSPYPEIEVVQVGTMEEMFRAVSESKADALMSKTYYAGYVMQNYHNLKIAGIADLPPEPYYYAVRKDYPELVGILNKAISSIPREKHDAIAQKWFSVRLEYRPNWSEILKWAGMIGGCFLLILGLLLVWNRRLAREIEKRKQAEEALKESELKYKELFERMSSAVALYEAVDDGEDFVFRDFNSAGETIEKVNREDIIGKRVTEVFPGVKEFGIFAVFQRVWKTGELEYFPAMLYKDEHGNGTWRESWVYKLPGGEIVAVYNDITFRKQAEDQIKKLLSEKELLIREVHHRIKNNMNVIMSLLSLQSDTLQDPSAIAALEDAKNRVRSMMILYDKLYRSADFREISAKEYLTSLIEEIVNNFSNRGLVTIETQIDDIILDAKMLSPLGIILNELLTNAMKHALIGKENGVIAVSLSIKDNHATLVVHDNGVGIPESVDIANSTGFGMQLVNILTEQIEGTMTIEQENGTKFILEFDI